MWKQAPLYLLCRGCSRAAASQSTRVFQLACINLSAGHWPPAVGIQKSTDDWTYSCVMKPVVRIHVGPMLLQGWCHFVTVSEWIVSRKHFLREHIQLEIVVIALLFLLMGNFRLIKQKWQVERDWIRLPVVIRHTWDTVATGMQRFELFIPVYNGLPAAVLC